MQEIGPGFEKETGHKLTLVTGLSPEFLKRINAGEPFDVIAAPPPVLDGLIKSGKVAASSKVNLVRSAVGVVVRAGAPKPDVSSVEAFKQTLLKAKSITYLPVPGVPQMLEQLGLKDALASKTEVPDTEISTELVARGEIELAIIVVTQAFTTPGVELAGPLPKEIQRYSVFGGAISHGVAGSGRRSACLIPSRRRAPWKSSKPKAWSPCEPMRAGVNIAIRSKATRHFCSWHFSDLPRCPT